MTITKSLLSGGIIAALMLCGCNNNEDFQTDSSQVLKSINVSIEDANYDVNPSTRSSYAVDPVNGFISSWQEGDTIGIYPIGGDQVAFPISEGEGSKTAKFDGGAWALRTSFQYAAYFPFNKKNYYISEKEIPVTYIGQEQTANNSTAHLGPYDYLAAAATSPNSDGNVNLAMRRLGCFVRIQIPIKVSGTFTELRISTSENLLTSTGTIDLEEAVPVITTKTAVSVLTISLKDIVVAKDETLVVYAMLAPVDLSDKTITLTLKNSANNYYYYTTAGKNMLIGKAYNYSITDVPDANGHDYVDLGLPTGTLWATMNIGATAPDEIGHYYFWGDVTPIDEPNWNYYQLYRNYKFFTYNANNQYTITKYSPQDEKAFLDPEDDVAHVEWGGNWRMPTITEIEELINNCTVETLTNGSTKLAKVTGPNGNHIYLPVGGRVDYHSYSYVNGKYKFSPYDNTTSTSQYPYGGFWSNQITPGFITTNSDGYSAATCLWLNWNTSSMEKDVWHRSSYCLNVRPVL